jgi:hypothetical protein
MLFILYAILAIAVIVIIPFWQIAALGILSALLFWLFHVHPAAVFGLYLVACCLRWLLALVGLAGAVTWLGRKK